MSIVTTDDKHYKAIADALRKYEPGFSYKPSAMAEAVDAVHLAGKVTGYQEGYVDGEAYGYESGYGIGYIDGTDDGRAEAEAECESKHYSAIVVGDGTGALRFRLPFEPDVVSVYCYDPDLLLKTGFVAGVVLNPSTTGPLGGFYYYTSTTAVTGYGNGAIAVSTLATRLVRDEDGNVCISNLSSAVFANGADYIVTASKTITKTDKERITEIINRLPAGGTGTISVWGKKKEAAFPNEDEWTALIATKPTYKITVI